LDEKTEKNYIGQLSKIMSSIAGMSPRLKADKDKIEEIFEVFEKYADIMREAMRGKRDLKLIEDDVLDHHKIAAALCCSVLKVRPIILKTGKSNPPLTPIEESANELYAYLGGLQAVQNYWNAMQKEKNISNKHKTVYRQIIEGPKPDDPKITYQDWFAKLFKEGAFKHFDYEDKLFEETLLFFISHIYFLIESYSFQYYLKRGDYQFHKGG
jgi:hypothetical protein